MAQDIPRREVATSQNTFFAPAERSSAEELQREIEIVSRNPVVDALLVNVGGLLAVLNERRQILAVNDTLMDMLGVTDHSDVLGLRPGEAIKCTHAKKPPAGCGTTKYCLTCAAVIAVVACLDTNEPQERDCVATVLRHGRQVDMYFKVRSCPIVFEGRRFVLLFLQDFSTHQKRAALERAFFHDINNIILALKGSCELLKWGDEEDIRATVDQVQHLVSRLGREVDIQRSLHDAELFEFQVVPQHIAVREIIADMGDMFTGHPAAKGKTLLLPEVDPHHRLKTDRILLVRILSNMLTNAFEATEEGGVVRLWLEHGENTVTFNVWNREAIPNHVADRIFQKNFTTKTESGRGLGTYAMKLLGEHYLGGHVDFSTSESDGTVFRLCLSRYRGN